MSLVSNVFVGVVNKTRVFAEMVKWEHSIFALPFAYMGAILAIPAGWPAWPQIGWITLAMVSGRTLAFALNRAIDKEIDARNPRTAERALPKGLLSSTEAWIFGVVALALFVLAVFNLAPVTRPLAPVVVAMFVAYPYMKRFTWLCHYWLGFCLGLAPVGAWIAVTGKFDPQPWLLFLAVTFWVGGFDIIYATQDVEVDVGQGLRSIPARFGVRTALRVTKASHAVSFALFVLAGVVLDLGVMYYAGIFVTGALLVYENWSVREDDLSKLDSAFFTMNGVISVVTFLFTYADKAFHV